MDDDLNGVKLRALAALTRLLEELAALAALLRAELEVEKAERRSPGAE